MAARESQVRGSASETRVACVICGEPVNTGNRHGGVEREVAGWEELRTGGGLHKLSDRRTTGRWRHSACRWEVAGQERLF